MIAIDDSKSMTNNRAVQSAFEAMAVMAKALTQLEVGELSVVGFGSTTNVMHHFTDQYSTQSGPKIMSEFSFQQKDTDFVSLLETSLLQFERAGRSTRTVSSPDVCQLELVVSDGKLFSNKEYVGRLVRHAAERGILIVFIVVDNVAENKESIVEMQSVSFEGGKLKVDSYFDSFPFPYYILLRNMADLPTILSNALRQWFELIAARASN